MKFLTAGLFLLLHLITVVKVFPQATSSSPYTFNLRYQYGIVMQHSILMAHLANQRPMGFEADVYKTTSGEHLWERIHKYPLTGVAFQYFKMDRDKPLGDCFSLVMYYGKNFLQTRKSALGFRIGTGPGYIERRFNRFTNYKNNLISSRLNFTLYGRLDYTFAITENWNVQAGIGLVHYSNGATKVPNQGINIPNLHIGFAYTPGKVVKRLHDSIPEFKPQTQLHLTLAGGFKQVYPVEGPTYFISTLSAYVNRTINHKSGLNLGTDLFFDGSNKHYADSAGTGRMYYKWGITGGHELFIGKVSLLTQLGFYLYDPLKLERSFYQRIGVKYYFRKNIFAAANVKLHIAKANLVEWGVGVKF